MDLLRSTRFKFCWSCVASPAICSLSSQSLYLFIYFLRPLQRLLLVFFFPSLWIWFCVPTPGQSQAFAILVYASDGTVRLMKFKHFTRWSCWSSKERPWWTMAGSCGGSRWKAMVTLTPTTERGSMVKAPYFLPGSILISRHPWVVTLDFYCVTVHLEGTCGGRLFDSRDVSFIVGEAEDKGVPLGVDRAMDKMQKGECCILYLKPK